MSVRFAAFILVALLSVSGCIPHFLPPTRPAAVPKEAYYVRDGQFVFAGSTTWWILCEPKSNARLSCKIWGRNGELTEEGTFTVANKIEGCYTQNTTRYKYGSGFLTPIVSKRGKSYYFTSNKETYLDQKIKQKYYELNGQIIENVQVTRSEYEWEAARWEGQLEGFDSLVHCEIGCDGIASIPIGSKPS